MSDIAIYHWLETRASNTVSVLEYNRLKKENEQLKQLNGHKRLAQCLKMNKKKVLRVMKLFGIKPRRRITPKIHRKPKHSVFPNLLMSEQPRGLGNIYDSDFTYLKFKGKWVYVSTVLDIYTR